MKSRIISAATIMLTALMLPAGLAAQTYSVSAFQEFGGGACANSINQRGWVAGQANNADNTVSQAALWTTTQLLFSRPRHRTITIRSAEASQRDWRRATDSVNGIAITVVNSSESPRSKCGRTT